MNVLRILLFALSVSVSAGLQAAEKADLKQAWRAQTKDLQTIADKLSDLVPESKDPQARQELFDFIYSNIAMAYFGVAYSDPAYPDFYPAINQVFRVGWPNPDDAYYYVPIDDDGVYKISGYRGTVRLIDFQISAGMAAKDGTGLWGPAQANYSIDDLKIPDTGWFEVVLSAQRPQGYGGNWWKLDKGAAWIMVRQRAYDWAHEIDGRFGIERLDRPAIRPRLTAEQIDAKLKRIATWAETWTRLNLTYAKASYEKGKVNQFQLRDFGSAGGFTGAVQIYPQAVFKLKPDEALIVETELPEKCRYWNFQLVDTYWRTLGGLNQMNSINAHQAKLDADGKFRFVVSAVDPGVPNWLDNMGYETGFVYGRWNVCSSTPLPVARVVKLVEVRKFLPADTPTVTSEERDKSIRERRLAAQMRKRW